MAPIDKIYAIRKRFSKNKENYPPRDPVEVVWKNRAGTFSYRCRSQLFEDNMSMVNNLRRVKIPKWTRRVIIEVEWDAQPELGHPFWEYVDRYPKLPKRVVLGRSLLGMFEELFITREVWNRWR